MAQPNTIQFAGPIQSLFKRILAGNPFYLASAGLLLYGINELTTNSKWVGAGFPLLRFNFCALILYETMLVGTSILLIRRKIWYDALLLFGLANLFVIVPFSLINRAVFLSSHLALAMSLCGVALAVTKFWAFKRYAPELNLPRRLLSFGLVMLLVNASAPLLFKRIAFNPDEVNEWLNFTWQFFLPPLAGLGLFLPRAAKRGNTPGGETWLPAAVFFGWVIVTACHLGGIGYSNSYVWNFSLLVPIAWVMTWTAYARLPDLIARPKRVAEQIVVSVPLFLPLLAAGSERIFLSFAGLNLAAYGLLLICKDRSFPALCRLLAAITIFSGGLPTGRLSHVVPGIEQPEWAVLSFIVCFFGLIFRFRDPRIAVLGTLAVIGLCCSAAPALSHEAVQFALVSLLAHSLRWNDQAHKGAAMLRILAACVWSYVSCCWLVGSDHPEGWLVFSAAGTLVAVCLLRALLFHRWRPLILLITSSFVLISEPATILGRWLNGDSPGMLAIGASFLLFVTGSIAAFSKPKWWRPGSAG
jgi:hypothetical protein